jgi:nucleotide-binding universal stress UspA family protein
MAGTIVCGVSEGEGRGAAELASALGTRLDLRVVLVSVVEGVPPGTHDSVTARQRRSGAEQTLAELAHELEHAETRVVVGEPAEALAQVAADEGADLIVVGSRMAGLGSRRLRSLLAVELEAATPVPVLVAPPATRKRSEQRLGVAINPT